MSRKIKEYNSVNIANISSASIWDCMKGNRDKLDIKDAVLTDSLFSRFLQSNGLSVNKRKETRDIVCITFGYASASAEEYGNLYNAICDIISIDKNYNIDFDMINEMDDITAYYMLVDASRFLNIDDKFKVELIDLFKKLKKIVIYGVDNFEYKKANELLEEFYENGCYITYTDKKKDKNRFVEEVKTTIKYKMLCRSTSKAKKMEIMFINEELYDTAIDYLTMGLKNKLPENNAKIVELSAYSTLICSSLINDKENTLHLEPQQILILKDVTIDSVGKAMNVYSEIDGKDEDGNDIYICKCDIEKAAKISNTLFDGQGLLEDKDLFNRLNCSFVLTRNHMWKSALFNTNIQLFFKTYCEENGYDYETYQVQDMFGHKLLAKNIKCIVSNESVKWTKFKELIGDDAYGYWTKWLEKDNYTFGIVKNDHKSKYGDMQRLSYQMINTLPTLELSKEIDITEDEIIKRIAKYSIDFTMSMKNDDTEYVRYLNSTKNVVNPNQMMVDLFVNNPTIFKTEQFVKAKSKKISKYKVDELMRNAKIQNRGDNLTIVMQPLAMLYHAVNDNVNKDFSLASDTKDYLTVSTKQFTDGEMIACFRNPHNSPNGICYCKNIHNSELDRYFNFNKNIICVAGGVNNYSDWQDRLNSADQDSDFVLSTNQTETVSCAAIAYKNYFPIVNNIELLGSSNYGNKPSDYANMDLKFGKARFDIGTSSNVAQLAMSYYWTALYNEDIELAQKILKVVAILATLAQVAIDQCKRLYVINVTKEIDRLRNFEFMKNKQKTTIIDKNGDEREITINVNIPKFYAENKIGGYNETRDKKKIENMRRRINNDIHCPMNLLYDILDTNITKGKDTKYIDITTLLVDKNKKYSRKKIERFNEIFRTYSYKFSKLAENNGVLFDAKSYAKMREALAKKEVESLTRVKLDQDDYIYLVYYAFNLTRKNKQDNNSKVDFQLLNALYNRNKELFMNCFKK